MPYNSFLSPISTRTAREARAALGTVPLGMPATMAFTSGIYTDPHLLHTQYDTHGPI